MSPTALVMQNQTDEHDETIDEPSSRETIPTNFNDSGYGSSSTTPNTTPSTTLPPNQKPREFRGRLSPFAILRGSKKKVVPIFDALIDECTRARFQTIQPHFEKLLLEHVQTGQKPGGRHTPMSTRIMMMGSSSSDATAHIVIFCRPEQKSLVQRFAKQDAVKNMCEPVDLGVPSFKIAVIDAAPRPCQGSNMQLEAVAEGATETPITSFCGLPISVKQPTGQWRNSTLGGVIKVITNAGEIELYGITVGHVLQRRDEEDVERCQSLISWPNDDGPDCEELDLATALAGAREYDVSSKHGETQESEDDDQVEVDLLEPVNFWDLEPPDSVSWAFKEPVVVGTLAHSTESVETSQLFVPREDDADRCYNDWALFKMSRYQENQIPTDKKAKLSLSTRPPGSTGRRSVYIICASAGVKGGELAPEPGRILLGPGESFVGTYMVTPNGYRGTFITCRKGLSLSTQVPQLIGIGICDGDSGSWVVDQDTSELYGHLVASDLFGTGYVIPMMNIFDDIKGHLVARVVDLPAVPDFVHERAVGLPGEAQARGKDEAGAVVEDEELLLRAFREYRLRRTVNELPLRYRLSADVALSCQNIIRSRLRMRKRTTRDREKLLRTDSFVSTSSVALLSTSSPTVPASQPSCPPPSCPPPSCPPPSNPPNFQ